MKAQPLLVGIDIGTSTLKVCVFSTSGQLIWQESAPVLLDGPSPNCVEMDLADLLAKLEQMLRKMGALHGADIEAIGFSVTNPTLVLLDRKLNAVRPGITFLDNRCTREVSAIVDSLGGPEKYFLSVGNRPSPSTCTAGLINHIKRWEPDHWSRTYKVGFLNTFLAAQFTGVAACDPTTASYSGLLNVRQPDTWNEELVKVAQIPKPVLPDLIHSCEKVGGLSRPLANSTGMKAGIPVAIGGGDTAAAAFALGLARQGDLFESMGTSEVISFCLEQPDLDMAFMNRSHVIPGLWLSHGAVSTSGAATAWLLKKVFPDIPDIGLLEEQAEKSPPGANGVIFIPYLAGERSPVFDSSACGAFFGLTLNSNRHDLIRAVYEGAGYAIKQIYTLGSSRWHTSPESIKCVGGAAGSLLSLQIRADMLGVELTCIEAENAAAYGAAMMGGMACGVYPEFKDVPCLNVISRRVRPRAERREIYDRYFAVYENLYPQLRSSMHRLEKAHEPGHH